MQSTERDDRREKVTLRSLPECYSIETSSAYYLNQAFKPHAHDEYLFGVIDGGVHSVWSRGALHHVPKGSVVTMRPGDVHYGGAGSEAGWRQRMLYIPEAGMRALLEDITGHVPAGTLDFGAAELRHWLLDQAFHATSNLDLAERLVARCRETQIILQGISTI